MDEVFDFNSLVGLCRETHQTMRLRAARSINIELVVRNWLLGWYLVEYEQKGADRAEYGAGLLEKLSLEFGSRLLRPCLRVLHCTCRFRF